MRGNEFLDKMELTDPAMVEQADRPFRRKKMPWYCWGGLAACLCLTAVLACYPFQSPPPGPPLLTLPESLGGDMGFEGYMTPDISELVSGSPWTEDMELTTLPVFKNAAISGSDNQSADSFDKESLQAVLLDTGRRLGVKETDLTITDDDIYGLIATADGLTIQVDQHLGIDIRFEPGLPLPDELNFTYHDSSYQDMQTVASWLAEEFAPLLDMEKPTAAISGGDRYDDGQQYYHVGLYEGEGSPEEQLIAYHFRQVTFGCNEEGRLWIIRLPQMDLSHVIGEYPLITSDDAKALLLEGHYVTSVPYALPGSEYLARVELCYYSTPWESIFPPYYRFLVELPEERRGNTKAYGAYYVPAVRGEYLTNMPLWDGGFN